VTDGDTSETGGELGDESAGDGEADEERPGALELALEEHGPWVEQPHPALLDQRRMIVRFYLLLSSPLRLSASIERGANK
jgi:hypothetical protein